MDLSSSRMPSRLELTYRQCAYDLLRMGTLGLWPDFASPTGSRRGAPRVGDGLIRLDAEGIVQYASPNGVSAFRRLGDGESLEGRSLAEVTAGLLKDRRMVDETLPLVVTGRMPWRSEIESRGVSLSCGRFRCGMNSSASAPWCSAATSANCGAGRWSS